MKALPAVLFLALSSAPALSALPWQPFSTLAVSGNGARLATGGMAGEVLCWEASTGEVLRKAVLGTAPVVGLGFSADGKQLGVVFLDGSFVLDLGNGEVVASSLQEGWGSLAASAGRWLTKTSLSGSTAAYQKTTAEGFSDGRIEIRPPEPSLKRVWKAHGAAVTGLAWSPDGSVLYSVSVDGTFARWDPSTGKELGRL